MQLSKLPPTIIMMVIIFLIPELKAQSWVKVEDLPTVWMTAFASDEDKLWVAGTNKLYFRHVDESTWDSTEIIHPDLHYISEIILYQSDIFVADEFKGVFKSEDQGESWQEYNQGLGFTHIAGAVIRGDSIYAGTIGEGIFVRNLRTHQGWTAFSSGVRWKNTESITNIGGTLIAGVGANATLFLNKEKEMSWSEIQFTTFNGSPSSLLAIVQAENRWIAAGNTGLFASSDKGQSWTQLNLNIGFIGQARLIYHKEILYAHLAKAQSAKLYYSTDNGHTWNTFSPALNSGLDLAFWNDQIWYATQNGLWRFELKTSRGAEEDLKSNFSVYPNPFKDELHLDIEIKTPGQYIIEMQSITGERIAIIEEKWLNPGSHFINWNSYLTSCNPGLYILRITCGSNVSSVKVLKI